MRRSLWFLAFLLTFLLSAGQSFGVTVDPAQSGPAPSYLHSSTAPTIANAKTLAGRPPRPQPPRFETDLKQFSKQLFQFDPQWEEKNPFTVLKDQFLLRVKIGAAHRMDFPRTLDSISPIVIHTRYGKVRQYLLGEDVYQGELVGRYLVYRGKEGSILFRYDTDE